MIDITSIMKANTHVYKTLEGGILYHEKTWLFIGSYNWLNVLTVKYEKI